MSHNSLILEGSLKMGGSIALFNEVSVGSIAGRFECVIIKGVIVAFCSTSNIVLCTMLVLYCVDTFELWLARAANPESSTCNGYGCDVTGWSAVALTKESGSR